MAVILTMTHVRAAGMCSRGARDIAHRVGIPWQEFLDEGVDVDRLRDLDDAMVQEVIRLVEEEAERG